MALDYDRAVTSLHGKEAAQGFDDAGHSLPGEMLPAELAYHGIGFKLGPVLVAQPNAVVARGQTLSLPAGPFRRVYLLAASAQGDQRATFRVGDQATDLTIQQWSVMSANGIIVSGRFARNPWWMAVAEADGAVAPVARVMAQEIWAAVLVAAAKYRKGRRRSTRDWRQVI